MTVALSGAKVVTPLDVIGPGTVLIDDSGTITYVGPPENAPPVHRESETLAGFADFASAGCLVTPGLVDIHTHGGHGITFGQGDDLLSDLRIYAAWVATTGVTGFLCSIAAPDSSALRGLVRDYAEILDQASFRGAQPLGLHLEGPYLNPEKRGAFNSAWLRRPLIEEMQDLLEAGRGWIRQVTLAPELPQAVEVAALLRGAGVVASLGHSNSDYATAAEALAGDFTHVTHTFNAQRGFHHREPGVLGAVLSSDCITAELIADTVHVHPGAMKVMMRCLGSDRVVLITDAMAAAGLGDGEYELVGEQVFVKDGVAREASGTIAGSTATLNRCVRNMVEVVGVPLPDAVKMATLNPARVLHIDNHQGVLAPGREATLTVLDPDFNVMVTMVRGQVVYKKTTGEMRDQL